MALDVEGRGNAEGVPRAVSVPRTAAGLNPVWGRHGGERVRHPDLGPVRFEHERVGVVEPAKRRLDPVAELVLQLRECRCTPELDEPPVDVVADLDVVVVHQDRELMAEVPAAREDHGGSRLFDRRDHFLVSLRTPGLDEGGDAGA